MPTTTAAMAGCHAFTRDCLSAAFADDLNDNSSVSYAERVMARKIAVSNCSFGTTTKTGSAGVLVYCENIDGSVCVDFKTRLVPFRLAQSQSVFSYVYIYICLSVCSCGLSSSTLCVVCVTDFLLRCCLHLIAQNLNAFLSKKLVFVCICVSEKTT